MRGLMMDFPLAIPAIIRRAEALFRHKTIAMRRPDRSIAHGTYGEMLERVRRLADALRTLGIRPGDRVATLAWASQPHLEAYLAIPAIGAVLHTLNLRLHHDDLAYIANDAEDRVLILDESLLPLYDQFRDETRIEHVIVIPSDSDVASGPSTGSGPSRLQSRDGFSRTYMNYDELLASADPTRYREADLREDDAAAMCYTSGTTGRPKGVLYSHRAVMLHCLGQGLVDALGISERDTVLPIVPMFHVNAWGMPFSATFFGANQIFPGSYLDPKSVLELLVKERVTVTAGVPTVWLGVLNELDQNPAAHDLQALRCIAIGGSAAPVSLIRAFKERHGIDVLHAWGMTEMTPLGTLCHVPSSLQDAPADEQFRYRAMQGTPLPFVEIRAVTENGEAPWDGNTMGELEVRGPWVAAQYYNSSGPDSRFTRDGWFKTGDIVTITAGGCIELADRAKDLVKSGGEWISSVALENALMGHPKVAEAAVIAVPHPKWDERPLAVVVLKPGQTATKDELIEYLAPQFAKWWLPDALEFIKEIPRTSAGKFKKSTLRERYREHYQSLM
jgi:acyl-CoA synthetase (AMP-forming)/AMP-acid ligase II